MEKSCKSRILNVVLAIMTITVLLPFRLSAVEFSYTYKGKTLNYDYSYGSVYVMPGAVVTGDVFIPDSVEYESNKCPVTRINDNAFFGCTGLTSVSIPNTVKYIRNGAFNECPALSTIIIEAGTNKDLYVANNALGTIIGQLYWGRESFPSDAKGLFSNVEEIIIGGSMIEIPTYTSIPYAENVKKLTLKNSVKSFSTNLFSSYNYEEIIIEDGDADITVETYNKWNYKYSPIKKLYVGRNVKIKDGYDNRYSIVPPSVEEFIAGKLVAEIPHDAFNGCVNLKNVVLPNSVVTIDDRSFKDCSALVNITLPDSLISIGESAFLNCTNLKEIKFPETLTSIGSSAFASCESLKEAVVPNSVIGTLQFPFSNCKNLETLIIGESVTEIIGTFETCSNLKSVIIGNSVSKCNSGILNGLRKLTTVYAGKSLDKYTYYSIYRQNKDNWPMLVLMPHCDDEIGGYNRINLEYYNPDDVLVENGWILSSDKSHLYLAPLSVTGDIVINEEIKSIGRYAFFDNKIKSITCTSSIPSNINYYSFRGDISAINVVVPDNSLEAYINSGWNLFDNLGDSKIKSTPKFVDGNFKYRIIGENTVSLIGNSYGMASVTIPKRAVYNDKFYTVASIGYAAFSGNGSLSSVSIPENITSIGDEAFSSTGLKEVKLPSKVNMIGNRVFSGCTNLKSIEVPSTVTYIGEKAFYNCKSMSAFEMPDGVTTVGKNAFEECTGLKSITLSSSLQSIKERTFYGCTSLREINIPNSVKSIDYEAFAGCGALEKYNVPDSVVSIGSNAFGYVKIKGAPHCPSVVIPGSVKFIGKGAIDNCNDITLQYGEGALKCDDFYTRSLNAKIKSVKLSIDRDLVCESLSSEYVDTLKFGNNVTYVSPNLFKGSWNLVSLTLGTNIKEIGESAFQRCALTELVLPPCAEKIGDNAFVNNPLTDIIMGANVVEIGQSAFGKTGCPIKNITITTPAPPAAQNNSFTDYEGNLYVMPGLVDTYYNSIPCFYHFENGKELVCASDLVISSESEDIILKEGSTFQLKAEMSPSNASLPQVFWSSTNPSIATVDADGVVTIHESGEAVSRSTFDNNDESTGCKIVARTLYSDGPIAEFVLKENTSGMDTIITDVMNESKRPNDVYNMQGILLKRNATREYVNTLSPGMYIIAGKKVIVR